MTDFVQYVVSELKSQRLSKQSALSLVRQFYLGANARAAMHPLLHTNASDLTQQRYSSTFSGDEFFLADHRVQTQDGTQRSVLPGVVYLEMARAAVEQALPSGAEPRGIELHDVVWSRPMFVQGPTEVSIRVHADARDEIRFEILSHTGEQDELVHAHGRVALTTQTTLAPLTIDALQEQMCGEVLDGATLYAVCEEMGLHYGPAHRAVQRLVRGEQQLLAQLQLPAQVTDASDEYLLHPSVMDAALQACLGLVVEGGKLERPWLPFALQSLRIFGRCTGSMWAWVRSSPDRAAGSRVRRFDIDLCDEQGRVSAQLRGFTTRELNDDSDEREA